MCSFCRYYIKGFIRDSSNVYMRFMCGEIACLLVGWLVGWLILNVPVNNFSVMLGRSHRFLGITSTSGE